MEQPINFRNPAAGAPVGGPGGLGAAIDDMGPSLAFKNGTLGGGGEKNATRNKLATLGAGSEGGRNCRICLDEADSEENPFITPCKCDGSMKFIHLTCLQEWLDSKRVS